MLKAPISYLGTGKRQLPSWKSVLITERFWEVSMSYSNFQRIGFATLFCLLVSLPALSDSQVRIVRLSYVEGSVQIARASAFGFDKALLNLPVAQGATLRTGTDGRAEVEFEDGTTIRLTAN